jgi:transposase-like protein
VVEPLRAIVVCKIPIDIVISEQSAGTMPHRVRVRSNKYLNNVVEQDHRRINTGSGRCSNSNGSKQRRSRSAA